MKKTALFVLIALNVLLLSCSKKSDTTSPTTNSTTTGTNTNPDAPSLKVYPNDSTILGGNANMYFYIVSYFNSTTSAYLTNITLKASSNNGVVLANIDSNLKANTKVIKWNYNFFFPKVVKDGDVFTIAVTVTDANGKTNTINRKITINSASALNIYKGVTLYDCNSVSSQSFFSTSDGKTHSYNDANNDAAIAGIVDFGYYQTGFGGYFESAKTFGVYNTGAWATRHNTKFGNATYITTSNQFDSASYALIYQEGNIVSATKTNPFKAGDIIAFETDASLGGIIRINSVNTSTTPNSVNFDMKIMKY